jgi:hypothetical protein
MTSKDIKLLAGNIVFESGYSDSAKKQLLNFIANEATEYQIKTLILDGNIEDITEDAENIIDKRFDIVTENATSEIIEDTIAFLAIGRNSICEFFESQGYEEDQLNEMKNFIMNEATDYQIMSILVDNVLPDEDSNPVVETMLFEDFNLNNNTNFVPLSEYGISSLNEAADDVRLMSKKELADYYKKLGKKGVEAVKKGAAKTAEPYLSAAERTIRSGQKAVEKAKTYVKRGGVPEYKAAKTKPVAHTDKKYVSPPTSAEKAATAKAARDKIEVAKEPLTAKGLGKHEPSGAAEKAAGAFKERHAQAKAAHSAEKAAASSAADTAAMKAKHAQARAAHATAKETAATKAAATHAAGPATPAAMAAKIPSKMPAKVGAADAAKAAYKSGKEYAGKAVKHGAALAGQVGGKIASTAAAHPVAAGLGAAALAGYAAHKLYKKYQKGKKRNH